MHDKEMYTLSNAALIFYSLVNRQKQWAKDEEDRRRNIPDPDLPSGHRVMSKSEQQETLKKLKDCKFCCCFL